MAHDWWNKIILFYYSILFYSILFYFIYFQDNKLHTFSNIYSNFSLQDYLSFGLPKDKTRELAKLRISAHDLLIERGRYFRPRIPRESRLCTSCNEIEDEEHFMLYCSMNSALRNDLFKTLNITYHDLKPGSDASFNAFAEETKYVCEFITMSLVVMLTVMSYYLIIFIQHPSLHSCTCMLLYVINMYWRTQTVISRAQPLNRNILSPF